MLYVSRIPCGSSSFSEIESSNKMSSLVQYNTVAGNWVFWSFYLKFICQLLCMLRRIFDECLLKAHSLLQYVNFLTGSPQQFPFCFKNLLFLHLLSISYYIPPGVASVIGYATTFVGSLKLFHNMWRSLYEFRLQPLTRFFCIIFPRKEDLYGPGLIYSMHRHIPRGSRAPKFPL